MNRENYETFPNQKILINYNYVLLFRGSKVENALFNIIEINESYLPKNRVCERLHIYYVH